MARISRRTTRRLIAAMTAPPEPDAPASTCRLCGLHIRKYGGTWTDPDGMAVCMENMTSVAAPHEPREG